MPNRFGSNRIGWNQRGPSNKDLFIAAKHTAEINDPDSIYWRQEAYFVKTKLSHAMGAINFEAWAESVYPGNSINDFTWREIYEAYQEKFVEIKNG